MKSDLTKFYLKRAVFKLQVALDTHRYGIIAKITTHYFYIHVQTFLFVD